MKTQEEIDKIRADYKKQWDLDLRRMEAKKRLFQGYLDSIIEAERGPIKVKANPGELFPGQHLRDQIAELDENIAFRTLQWELIQDEFDASDKVRGS